MESEEMEMFWFFQLRFRRAYDSAYDSDYDSDSDSVANENQPLVKSNKQQTNCLQLMISHEWNHAELYISCAHLEGMYALKKIKKSPLFENSNDAYIILITVAFPARQTRGAA